MLAQLLNPFTAQPNKKSVSVHLLQTQQPEELLESSCEAAAAAHVALASAVTLFSCGAALTVRLMSVWSHDKQ